VKSNFDNYHSDQQLISIVPAEALDMLDYAENFDAVHPNGEKSQIVLILTAYTETYHNAVRKSWLFLSWLVG